MHKLLFFFYHIILSNIIVIISTDDNFNNKIILYNTLDTFHICNSKSTVINKIKKVFVDILPETILLNSFDSLMRQLEPNGLIRVLNNYS